MLKYALNQLIVIIVTCLMLALAVTGDAMAQSNKPERGKLLFNRCRACHTLDEDAKPRLGPHLVGLFDRRAGELNGFKFSKALKDAGFRWTEDRLDAWLKSPNSYLPGNRMSFAGIPSAQDRAQLIAYLKSATKTPQGR